MTSSAQAVGRYGERVAHRYLENLGWQVLATNWACARGELDLIARDGATLVAVEVKTRRGNRTGSPEEAVTPAKLRRIRLLLGIWLSQYGDEYPWIQQLRIDVIAIVCQPSGPAALTHLKQVSLG